MIMYYRGGVNETRIYNVLGFLVNNFVTEFVFCGCGVVEDRKYFKKCKKETIINNED